ncbi:MAG TPA: response regulator [Deltaproteobacteria bacterium]|nr:response regulator [Deltaproteobacteria bacterium]
MTEARNRVLIVDDEVFFLEAIDEILVSAGFETLKVEDGESALDAVTDPTVGVVVLDVRLPDMDGIQVLASIREMRPELSVIMLSASTDQEIVLEALRLGACDYLAKPLHDEELSLAVGRALDAFEANSERRRLRGRIDRLVTGMDRLSQLVRLAAPEERVAVLRQGVVDAASVVFQASRVSLMLADAGAEWLSVVATRGIEVDLETLSSRKIGEGASGICFQEGNVLCVADVEEDPRFSGRGPGEYESGSFAIVPLVCLGVPVGVLCLTESADPEGLSIQEGNVLRLLGMQVSEFLAADPEIDSLLQAASVMSAEGISGVEDLVSDVDAELARAVCEAIAAEVEPERVLGRSLEAVAKLLSAAPVSLFLLSNDRASLELEAEADGGVVGDRATLPVDRGWAGLVVATGQLVATEDAAADDRFDADVDTPSDGFVRPCLCVPIKLRGKVVGVLRVFLEEGRCASPRSAEVLCAAFSAAVRNTFLYRSLLESIEEVADARRQARS